jgi:ribose transport system permease protein
LASIRSTLNLPVTKRKSLQLLTTIGPLLVLIILVIGLAIINPRFISSANLSNLARQGAIALIIALGMLFIILMGSIDLSAEGNMALSSVVVGLFAANYFNDNNYGCGQCFWPFLPELPWDLSTVFSTQSYESLLLCLLWV